MKSQLTASTSEAQRGTKTLLSSNGKATALLEPSSMFCLKQRTPTNNYLLFSCYTSLADEGKCLKCHFFNLSHSDNLTASMQPHEESNIKGKTLNQVCDLLTQILFCKITATF